MSPKSELYSYRPTSRDLEALEHAKLPLRERPLYKDIRDKPVSKSVNFDLYTLRDSTKLR